MLNPKAGLAASHKQMVMKTISTYPESFESTYALLMRSEERQRSRFEMLIYSLLLASTMFAVSQFGRQAALMPSNIAAPVATAASGLVQHGA